MMTIPFLVLKYWLVCITVVISVCHCIKHELAPKHLASIGGSPVYSSSVVLPANSTTPFVAKDTFASATRFLVFEVHTQALPVALSYKSDNPPKGSDSDTGTNTGLVFLLDAFSLEATTYIHNLNPENVTALLVVVAYGPKDPIPGGCNMEFPVEISPFLHLFFNRADVTLEFQHASKGYPRDGDPPPCDRGLSSFQYHIYVSYLNQMDYSEEHYFDRISRMVDVDSIKRNAHAVHGYRERPQTRALLLSYPGEGAVYNIIVQHLGAEGDARESAYVPVATYGCLWFTKQEGCEQTSALGMVFAIVITVVGLIICFRGHRFFTFGMFFFGFLAFSLVSFVLLTKFANRSATERDTLTLICGFAGGLVWMGFWWFLGIPVLSVILSGLVLGFLTASTLLFTPFGDLDFLKSDFTYWVFLSCIMLITVIILLPATKFLSIFSCAVVGGYCAIVALDQYLKTSLSYIILNVLKRSLVKGGYHASNEVPFQTNDIILSCAWAAICFLGLLLQLRGERGRPPFPQAPYHNWVRERARHAGRRLTASCTCGRSRPSPSAPPFVTETDPLIYSAGPTVRQYNTMPPPPPAYTERFGDV